ncbi:MAG TPA: MFS transporter [Burkholderiales bacterium]|nr:MFS transporter [Burkholderiales bacterium]
MPIAVALALTFIAFTALNAARVLLSLYALTLGAPASSVGVLGGMFYVFPLLLSWPIGALSDRIGPRRLLIVGAVAGTGALLLPYFVRQVGAFYAAAALSGLSIAFYHVTLQNLVGTLSTPQQRARNFSNFSLVGALTSFVGPLMAGVSIDHIGHANAALAIVGLSLCAFVALAIGWRHLPKPRPPAPKAAAPADMPADPGIWRMLTASAMVQLGTDLFQFYIPIYGHEIGLSASAIGLVLASFAAAAFVVRIFLPRLVKQARPDKVLMYSFYAGALGFLAVPFFHSVLPLMLCSFSFGLGMGCGTPLTVMLMFETSSAGRSGRTLGIRLTTTNAVRAFGPMIFGAIGTAFGIPPVFWINGALMAAQGYWTKRSSASKS